MGSMISFTPVSDAHNKTGQPVVISTSTRLISLYNNGADDKHDLRLSVADGAGGYKRVVLLASLPQGGSATVDLSPLKMKVADAALMCRGKDGIGRYVYARSAAQGKFFAMLTCSWIALPEDPTIEEWGFVGQ